MDELVTPGERIGTTDQCGCGLGVYRLGGYIYASVTGFPKISDDGNGKRISVENCGGGGKARLPTVGSIVLAQISRISRFRVECKILAVEGKVLSQALNGMIRPQDILSGQLENVDVTECFCPSDVVRAQVISTDTRIYILSTASVDLGVIFASSTSGYPLQPISYNYMRCSQTGLLEKRKVAQPPM